MPKFAMGGWQAISLVTVSLVMYWSNQNCMVNSLEEGSWSQRALLHSGLEGGSPEWESLKFGQAEGRFKRAIQTSAQEGVQQQRALLTSSQEGRKYRTSGHNASLLQESRSDRSQHQEVLQQHGVSNSDQEEVATTSVIGVTQDEWLNGFGIDDNGGSDHRATADIIHAYMGGVVIPAIGVLGVIGNLLNLAILSWRCIKRDDDTLEKVALIGLIALAVSDLCFCFTIIPYAFVPKPQVLYEDLSFGVYFHVYGQYAQNVFIKTSTWLTMIVATARYIAICHPLKARFCFGIRPTRFAIVSTYVFWGVFLLPLSWTLQILPHQVDVNTTFYLIDHGPFTLREQLHNAFTYLWALIGYFIPVAILGFCNVRLIQALRESRRLRKSVAHCTTSRGQGAHGHNANARKTSNRITLTLIALVLMFLVLVCPSELLHFWTKLNPESFAKLEVAMVMCNVLQAFNFALHFVLYCVVNVTFRRTLVLLAMRVVRWVRRGGRRYPRAASGQSFASLSRRGTLTPSNMKSNETNI